MYILKHYARFLVPSTAENDRPISDHALMVRATGIRRAFSLLFGGSTSTRAIGDFIGETGTLISERIIVVTSYSDQQAMTDHHAKVFYLARFYARAWAQESIGIVINRTFYIVSYDGFYLPVLSFSKRARALATVKGWLKRDHL